MSLALRVGAIAVAVGLSFIFGQQAFAANTVSSATYLDTNTNGTVETIRWTMDENVTACAFESGDWSVSAAGTIGVTAVTALSCTGSDAILNITVTTTSNVTGGAVNPSLSYANAGTAGSVTLTSGAMTAKVAQASTDAAAPVIVSVSPTVNDVGVGRNANITMTFSEPMDTTFAEGTEFAVTPDPGAFSTAFTVGNTVVTITAPLLDCGTTYAVDADSNAVDASAGTPTDIGTGGPVDGTWSFDTVSCGSSSSSGERPSNITVTYNGASCSTVGAQSFSLAGSSVEEYVVADNEFLTGAEWAPFASAITAQLDTDASMAYFIFRSADMNTSNAFSVSLQKWSTACASSDDEEATPPPADDENDNNSGTVVPVPGVSPGDVIRSSSSDAVYYVTEDYGRYVFMNSHIFFTWYDSFASVKLVSDATLSALPLRGLMLPKAGVVLIKIQSDNRVYVLEQGTDLLVPRLRALPDEATAQKNFGNVWARYVIDVEPTFFTKFEKGVAVPKGFDLNVSHSMMKYRDSL